MLLKRCPRSWPPARSGDDPEPEAQEFFYGFSQMQAGGYCDRDLR